jgi:hypothetical protein
VPAFGKGDKKLILNFPNPSRSYDAERRRVRFWAHDSAMEVPLFVKESALLKLDPSTGSDERALLATFDAHRDRINAVADKIYSFDRQVFHVLDASDF